MTNKSRWSIIIKYIIYIFNNDKFYYIFYDKKIEFSLKFLILLKFRVECT